MFKTVIAGVTALSLTMASATPAQANGSSQDQLGKVLFGLVAAATLGAALKNNNRDRHETRAPVLRQPTAQNNRQTSANNALRQILPSNCLRPVQTRLGAQRIFTRDCLSRGYARAATLPRQCAARVMTRSGPVSGYDPTCLQSRGFHTRQR